MPQHDPKMMTSGQLAAVIREAEVDPRDEEAVIRALVERGRRPEEVSPTIFGLAARLVDEGKGARLAA